jgi:hypothetical protein
MIRKFFSPPTFKSEDDNFRTKFINRFAWSVIALLFVAMLPFIVNFPIDVNYTFFVLPGLIVVLSTAVFLFRRRYLNASGLIIVLLGWLGFGIQANTGLQTLAHRVCARRSTTHPNGIKNWKQQIKDFRN